MKWNRSNGHVVLEFLDPWFRRVHTHTNIKYLRPIAYTDFAKFWNLEDTLTGRCMFLEERYADEDFIDESGYIGDGEIDVFMERNA